MIRKQKTVLALVFGALLLVSCGGPRDGEAFEHVAHRADSSSRVRPYSSITDLRDLVIARKEAGVGSELIVLGTITAVNKGASFSWDVDDEGNEVTVQFPFGDDRAMGHTVHLTVSVSEVIAPQVAESLDEITVGLVVDAGIGFDAVKNDYSGLGTVVLYLKQSAVFDYEPGIYGIFEDGALMGELKDDGNLQFPALLDPETLLDGNRTIPLDSVRTVSADR